MAQFVRAKREKPRKCAKKETLVQLLVQHSMHICKDNSAWKSLKDFFMLFNDLAILFNREEI